MNTTTKEKITTRDFLKENINTSGSKFAQIQNHLTLLQSDCTKVS